MSAHETFANELEALRAGQLGIDELWGGMEGCSVHEFVEILAFVQHYVDDDDFRAKDADYREAQEREFDRLLSALRSGRMAEAKRITFLGSTGQP